MNYHLDLISLRIISSYDSDFFPESSSNFFVFFCIRIVVKSESLAIFYRKYEIYRKYINLSESDRFINYIFSIKSIEYINFEVITGVMGDD